MKHLFYSGKISGQKGVCREKTEPRISSYRGRGLRATVDGYQPVATVTAALIAALGAD